MRKITCVGGGVIGGGWAARFALAGLDVVVADPAATAQQTVDNAVTAARRAWRKLNLSPPTEGVVQVVPRVEDALHNADFVQESLPEREDLKIKVLAQIDALTTANTIIASSTSGLLPSRLQSEMKQPQRFCVAHPFNPVYLLPLVEVCGGEKTAAATTTQAADFYTSLGMKPLPVRAEIDGFIADRLMEALWREALWLVHDNVATAEEIDDAVRFGCGLRWAFMGPFLTYRLGGGAGGMRHFMAQFAPSLKLPWTKLMDTPEMDDLLLDKIVTQSDAQAAGRSINDLTALRDDCLIAVMQGLKSNNTGAGAALREYENRRSTQAHQTTATANNADAINITAPLCLHQAQVSAKWIDYNGHMTESRYLQVFSDTTDALLRFVGIDFKRANEDGSYYTVETHIRHLAEAREDNIIRATTQLLAVDGKRLHLFHTLYRGETMLATAEQMLIHVRNGRAIAADEAVLKRLQHIMRAHQEIPPPQGAGRKIGEKR